MFSVGGTGYDSGEDIDLDFDGNSYVTGQFTGTVDFDPGAGVFNLTSNGSQDVYLAKYDMDGAFQWAVGFGGADSDIGHGVGVDDAGNVYVSGRFTGTADFDPNGTFELTSNGGLDIFVAKYDNAGNFLWAISFGSNIDDAGEDHAVDPAGNVYVTGGIQGTVDFDPGPGVTEFTSTGSLDIYRAKYDADGNLVWAFVAPSDSNNNQRGFRTVADAAGNSYVTGWFKSNPEIDNVGGGTLNNNGKSDAWIGKFDPDGNYLWAFNLGAGQRDLGLAIAVDNAGNAIGGGFIKNVVDFDPGPGTFELDGTSANSSYLAKYDPDGGLIWAFLIENIAGNANSQIFNIGVDNDDNYYIAGFFEGTVDLDPNGSFEVTSDGVNDGFVAKYDANGNFIWGFKVGGDNNDFAQGVDNTSAGTIMTITGRFQGDSDFSVNQDGSAVLSSVGSDDIFLAQYNQSGLNAPPVAGFTATPGIGELDLDLDGSGSTDADGTIVSWDWDFGDGNTGTGEATSHTYAVAGVYTIALTVTDDLGATSSTSQEITVGNPVPEASFTSMQMAGTLDVDFDGSASTDNGAIVNWDWDFGDGNTGTGETTSHAYAADGTYTVTLTVTDDGGATATDVQDVLVTPNAAPAASFTFAATGLSIDVDGSGSSDDGAIVSWDWDFGDGATGTGEMASHSYVADGTYTVTLTVTDDGGLTGVQAQDVTIEDGNLSPVASFTATPVAGTLDVDFDGSGSTDDGAIVSWDWDFGDGAAGTGQTTLHTYAAAGTYAVTLTVTDDGGLTGMETMDVVVTDPNADGAFLESGGMVVMEAENAQTNVPRSDHEWLEDTNNAGFSGASAMLAGPDDGFQVKTDAETTSPELAFDIDVTTTGDYHVWGRVWAPDKNGNSVYVGFDGVLDGRYDVFQTNTYGEWLWVEFESNNAATAHNIGAAGMHTVHFWLRKDGLLLDKIVMTTDPDFVPTGEGPAESPRGTAAPSLSKRGAFGFDGLALDEARLDAVETPDAFALNNNYPNPFNPTTTIPFALPEAAGVRLIVYDMTGRQVAALVDASLDAGYHEAVWDGRNDAGATVASGLYLVRMTAGTFVSVKQVALLK